MHQCYYCEQLFDSKNELYEHLDVHTDIERNQEIMDKKKEGKKSLK
ncbi:MAG: Zinc finger, type protein (modular protein) [Nitrosarchaeum sp.]|nr:Zinc finger, type protein (modular protein) [Nitrosarchaeum sp.]